MDGKIDDRNPTYLLQEIKNNLGLEIKGDKSLDLIYKVLKPFLQKQFNEGVAYAKLEMTTVLHKLDVF